MRFLKWQDKLRYGVGDFSSFVSCKKSIACLTLLEKRASEAAWMFIFLIPAGCWLEEFSCDSVEWTSRSRRLALGKAFLQLAVA